MKDDSMRPKIIHILFSSSEDFAQFHSISSAIINNVLLKTKDEAQIFHQTLIF